MSAADLVALARAGRARTAAATRPPSSPTAFYRIDNAASAAAPEILIYGPIGPSFWDEGIAAADLARDVSALDVDEITVRINSPGGNVFEGIAILNALRAHRAKITTIVDGIAASAASFIAMAGDQIVIRRNAEMMIHDAAGLVAGNAADMHEMAETLDRVSDNIASIYADRAGGTPAQWRAAMVAETWYSDAEAVAAGLADRVEATAAQPDARNAFDLSVFAYSGRRNAPNPTETGSRLSPRPNRGVGSDTSRRRGQGASAQLGPRAPHPRAHTLITATARRRRAAKRKD